MRSATHYPEYAERRPRWSVSEQAQDLDGVPTPVRELVARVPAPGRDHREDEPTTLLKQRLVETRIVDADLVRHVCNVELDGPTAAGLEVDEERAFRGTQEVPRMRLPVQKLVLVPVSADCSTGGMERVD